MIGGADAVDLTGALSRARSDYLRYLLPIIERGRRAGSSFAAQFDDVLEAQARASLIDPLLTALNWSFERNIVVEAISQDTARRRIDYAGVENGVGKIALIVEAKRPSVELPPPTSRGGQDLDAAIADTLHEIKNGVTKGFSHQRYLSSFISILAQVHQYVRDTHAAQGEAPKRVVLTNGTWLVIFETPEAAFISTDVVQPNSIFILPDERAVLQNASKVFKLLAREYCVEFPFVAHVNRLLNHCTRESIRGIMFGFVASADQMRGSSRVLPSLNLEPVIVVQAEGQKYIIVETQRIFPFPHRPSELAGHEQELGAVHAETYRALEQIVGRAPPILSVVTHYEDAVARDTLPVLHPIGPSQYVLLTGQKSHFVVPNQEFELCRYHSVRAEIAHEYVEVPPMGPNQELRTFQFVGERTCCASSANRTMKSASIDSTYAEAKGVKSVRESEPFCKLISVETFLCCKTCVYQDICGPYAGRFSPCRND